MLGWIKAEHIDCPACRRIFTGKLSAVIPGGAEGGGTLRFLTSVKNGFITALRICHGIPSPVKRILVAGSHHEIFAQARGCAPGVRLPGGSANWHRRHEAEAGLTTSRRGETSTAFIINSTSLLRESTSRANSHHRWEHAGSHHRSNRWPWTETWEDWAAEGLRDQGRVMSYLARVYTLPFECVYD